MSPLQKKLLKALGILFLVLAIPLTLLALKQNLEIRKEAAEANNARFSLVPNSATLAVNETIMGEVWLDNGSKGAVTVTSVINFDKNHLRAQNITTTNVFANEISITPIQEANTNGKITIIQGLSGQQREPVVGSHKIAYIKFKATAVTGALSTDNVSFDTNDSKVANSQASWMTVTAQGARYTVSGEVTPSPTPTSQSTTEPTLTFTTGTGQIVGDFNNDNTVDLLDFEIFRDLYVENLD